jgi:hypothetical protein
LLLCAYVLTAAGIPLPLAGGRGKAGEAFPCADNGCGCDSADRCWRSCCCHTLAERLAWARRNGVRPPDFALAQARAAGIDLSLLVEACDAGEQQDKCCAAKRSPEKAGCCTERQVATNANQFNGDADVNHIIGWRAMACRGQAIHWLAAVPTLIMPPHALLNDPPLVERCAPAVSEVAGGVPDAPDVPPPEVSSLA